MQAEAVVALGVRNLALSTFLSGRGSSLTVWLPWSMRVNPTSVSERLLHLLGAGATISELMAEIIGVCRDSFAHADWTRLAALDWSAGGEQVRRWVPDLLDEEPPPSDLSGLWFGLVNPITAGTVRSDIHLVGTRDYDPDDADYEWTLTGIYYPAAYANPSCLEQLYAIAYENEHGLGNDAEWALALAFCCAATAYALEPLNAVSVSASGRRIGIAAGFDDGDFLALGELTRDRFQLQPKLT